MKYIFTLFSIVTLAACGGGGSSEPTNSTPAPPVNAMPVVDAGPDQTVTEGSDVALSGSATDSDGTISSYSWQLVSGPQVSLNNASAGAADFTAPQVNANTVLQFRLTAADNSGGSASDDVTITVTNNDGSYAQPGVATELPRIAEFGIVTDILALDLNNDQLQDIIVFSTRDVAPWYQGYRVQAVINQGDGSFVDQTTTYFPVVGASEKWVDRAYLADLNQDGLSDLVLHVDSGKSPHPFVRVSRDGPFTQLTDEQLQYQGALLPIDFDQDGKTDLLDISVESHPDFEQQHLIRLVQNTGTAATLEFSYKDDAINDNKLFGLNQGLFRYSPQILDIDNNGSSDLIYGGPIWRDGFVDELSPMHVFLNDGSGGMRYASGDTFGVSGAAFTHLREMEQVDIDNSGVRSLVVTAHGYDKPPFPGEANGILRNHGDGTFSQVFGDSSTFNYKGFTHAMAVADINQDGTTDIIFVDLGGEDVTLPTAIRVLLNSSGEFTNSQFVLQEKWQFQSWTSAALMDLNNDGYPDLVLGGIDSNSSNLVFWNNTEGDFVQ